MARRAADAARRAEYSAAAGRQGCANLWAMRRWSPPAWLLAAVVGAVPAAVALSAGLPATVDGPLHLDRTASVAYLLAASPGLTARWPLPAWPRWAPHLLQGWGYPIHHFYPPGVPLVAGLAVTLGAEAVAVHAWLVAAAWCVACVGAYRLARHVLPPSAALLAAGAVAFSPVRLAEVQVLGNLPQLVATALVPLALDAAVSMARAPSPRRAVALGAWLAAVALCHHVTLALAAPLAAATVAAVALVERSPWRRRLAAASGVGAAGVTAAVLAAVFLWPAAVDASRVQLAKAAAGMFDAAGALVPPADLVRPLPRLDRTALSLPLSHGWGPGAALLGAIGVLALLRGTAGSDAAARRRLAALAALGAATVALAVPIAAPAWRLGWAGLVQFPWRLLGPAEPLLAPAVGAALLWLPPRRRAAGLVAGLAVLAAAAAPWLPPLSAQPRAADTTPRAAVLAERRPDAPPGTTSSQEYLPRGARVDLSDPPSADALAAYAAGRWWIDVDRPRLPAGLAADVVAVGRRGSAIALPAGPAVRLPLRQLWFPGWQATVDGQRAPVRRTDGGALAVEVPASAAPRRVAVAFAGTAWSRLAGLVSLAGWLAAAAWVALGRRRPTAPPAAAPSIPSDDLSAAARRRLAVGLAVAAVAAAVALPRWAWLAPRSPVTAPLRMTHALGAVLADDGGPAVALIGYDAPDGVVAGRTASVRLYWRALRPLERRYRPFAQLVTHGTASVVANHTATDPGGRPTRSWPLDRYVVDVHPLAAPRDAPALTVALVVGLFDDDTGTRLWQPGGGDVIRLGDVRLSPRPGDPHGRRRAAAIATAAAAASASSSATAVGATEGRPSGAPAAPARFGSTIVLDAAVADWVAAAPAGADGGGVRVTLAWRAVAPTARRLTVFRHVLAADGTLIAQADGPPAGGDAPTDDWRAGDRIVDTVVIGLPADAGVAGAPVRIAVGLYDPADGARLAAVDAGGRPLPDAAVAWSLAAVPASDPP